MVQTLSVLVKVKTNHKLVLLTKNIQKYRPNNTQNKCNIYIAALT